MKQTKPKYKIFEEGDFMKSYKKAQKEGYELCTLEETYRYLYSCKIRYKYFFTSLLEYQGLLKPATKQQLKNIEDIYKSGGRLWCVYRGSGDSIAYGNYDLVDFGRLVGGCRSVGDAKKKVKKTMKVKQ